MLTRLKPWQTVLLFIPFFVSFVISRVPNSAVRGFDNAYHLAEILSTFNISSLVVCQAYLLLKFNGDALKRINFFSINTIIPALSTVFWFVYEIYDVGQNHNASGSARRASGPVDFTTLHGYELIVALLLLHTFITFFIVNNQYVAWKIKKLPEPSVQTTLTHDYLKPMRLIVRTSMMIFGIGILLDILYDLVIKFT